jgi:hypothetical protein
MHERLELVLRDTDVDLRCFFSGTEGSRTLDLCIAKPFLIIRIL